MENLLFTFFLCENCNTAVAGLSRSQKIGNYNFLYDESTPFSFFTDGQFECALFGLATNVLNGEHEKLPQSIVNNCRNIDEVINYEKNLGGKYIILYNSPDGFFMLGDATCSIPVFYDTEGEFICSSNPQLILNQKNYTPNAEFNKIRKSGDVSQAMPFDITAYKEIKQLIPNHALNVGCKKTFRFINSSKLQETVSVEKATEIVSPMIENLLSYYLSLYKIYCPITSGRDSRVVLSFLMKAKADVKCYTIKHPHHTDKSQDITVPAELCAKNGIHYDLIEDVAVSDDIKYKMDEILGKGQYSTRTLQIAMTVKEHCKDSAIINGDIIGQVGKCSLHRDIPIVFATPSYFRCKLHNYSKGAKVQLRQWIKEIKINGEKTNLFDLFSIENRMGRWAGQENLIYNTLGQVYLNIFNCRNIIYTWTAVERKERKHSMLHIDLIKKTYGVLLDIPFEKDESIVFRISKATGLTYLLSSYMKYYIEKNKFSKGRRA